MNPIYLEPTQVPQYLRNNYAGKKFKALVTESVTIPIDAELWSGGSRDTFHIVRLADGRSAEAINHNASPFGGSRQEKTIQLEPGIVVIEHSMFCGKDMGITFHIHPSDVAKPLPAPSADPMTPFEQIVLNPFAHSRRRASMRWLERLSGNGTRCNTRWRRCRFWWLDILL